MILSPDPSRLQFDSFIDADVAGLFIAEDTQDPISDKIRTGLLINFDGVAIFWSLKLQTEIALPTLEAECIALSQGMKKMVSDKNLVLELKENTNLDLKEVGVVPKV